MAQLVKNLPAMWGTCVRSLDWEGPLEKEKATHANILAWRIPWDRKESDTTEQLSLSLRRTKKLKAELPCDPASPLLRIYPEKEKL